MSLVPFHGGHHESCVDDNGDHFESTSTLEFPTRFISTPEYPKLIPNVWDCNWTIIAPPGKIVSLQLIMPDVSEIFL